MPEVRDPGPDAGLGSRLITVGIPVFNGKSLLRNCLHSVVSSTLSPHLFEIIIADDGSTEAETLAILDDYKKRTDDRPGLFRVLTTSTNSGGAARPRNRILDAATGDYVFFVDADDIIGDQALERIAEVVARDPADWIAVNQVASNGRAAVCAIGRVQSDVPRLQALSTLTVHKVFRRGEIERQQLRFDEALPSGQDLSFAFSYILNAQRFLMLGGYDYYYLTQHVGDPSEPDHLSKRAKSPQALLTRGERILRSMLQAASESELPEQELRSILARRVLPRMLLHEKLLSSIIKLGPEAGPRALEPLSELLDVPLVAGLDPAGVAGLTRKHLDVVLARDWAGLRRLVAPAGQDTAAAGTWRVRAKRVLDDTSGRTRHQELLGEIRLLRRSVEELRKEQRKLKADLDQRPSR